MPAIEPDKPIDAELSRIRLEECRAKLKASTKGPNGPPLPGYTQRVEALRAEIARLENG